VLDCSLRDLEVRLGARSRGACAGVYLYNKDKNYQYDNTFHSTKVTSMPAMFLTLDNAMFEHIITLPKSWTD
jgi:hypothetical protein